ncbi:MAG: CAP domain-containing protein [Lachnospiraceae bacterium]|nr:CAP domain-containing protein [Lachnospiraceae bacterium]
MKKLQARVLWIFVACAMLFFNVQIVEAASTKNTTGTCEYDKAYEVLKLINEERADAGKQKLTMDKDLLEAAMLRAAEITVSFDHVRPNGTKCFTVCDKVYAENIAYGYETSADVVEGWMSSKQGHRESIMNGDYETVGIGCFKQNGVRYWVQCFGYDDLKKVSQPDNVKRTYIVALTSSGKTTIKPQAETKTETKTDTEAQAESEADDTVTNPLQSGVSGVKVSAGKKKLTITWKKKSGVSGYKLQISTSKSFKSKQTYTIGKNTTKKVIKKYKGKSLKAKKKYYIRIRAYIKSTDADGVSTVKYSKWKTLSKKTK